jgi:hypothetical protein
MAITNQATPASAGEVPGHAPSAADTQRGEALRVMLRHVTRAERVAARCILTAAGFGANGDVAALARVDPELAQQVLELRGKTNNEIGSGFAEMLRRIRIENNKTADRKQLENTRLAGDRDRAVARDQPRQLASANYDHWSALRRS